MAIRHDTANLDLLARLPLAANAVLDVGCASGALGHAYRRRNPRARQFGIDVDPHAAALAAERLDAVALGDVEADPLPFDDPPRFDCIVYGDVLQYLRDPWAVMRAHAAALSEHGTVLICVPNVEHWSLTERLLRGTWDYEDDGLLARGHLRWFSLRTMRRALEEAGLAPCDVFPRLFNTEGATRFTSALSPALHSMGIDPAEYAQRAAPLQFIWRAQKQPAARMVVGASMLPPVGGVSHVRVVHPLMAIGTEPGVAVQLGVAMPPAANDPDVPRIFVLHRPILTGDDGLAVVRRLIAEGWVVVTEFDDHPDFLLDNPPGDDQFAFAGVHAVQTSTERLAEVLRGRNPEVRVFPNAMSTLPEPRNFRDARALTLFFGALNRERDWEPVMPAINAVAQAAGARLRFEVVHDQAFFDALQTPHKRFTPTCDYDQYLELLGGCEISLMPLRDTAFNRAKSDLKFIEAGACRVAALAAPIVYGGTIEDGRTGLLFDDPAELHDRLLRLVAMPDLARALGDAARAYVAGERMLAYQVADRIAWYHDLWRRRNELTAALVLRLAGVRPSDTP